MNDGGAYGPGTAPDTWRLLQFRVRVLRADLGNFFLLQHRKESGFIVTGKNSGSHWLKFMLNNALAAQFGVPPPPYSTGPSANHFAGQAGWPPPAPGLPHFATTHTIPSAFFAWRFAFRIVPRRPVVLLVRDIEDALCSNYLKWRECYGGCLADYVRGDPSGRRHVADAWWYAHFLNRWGDVACAHPGLVLPVRFEAMRTDPATWLSRIAAHLGVGLSAPALAAGLAFCDRESMRVRQDFAHGEIVVPEAATRESVHLDAADRQVLRALLARVLRHDPPPFGEPPICAAHRDSAPTKKARGRKAPWRGEISR